LSFTDLIIQSKFSCLKLICSIRRQALSRSSLLKVALMLTISTAENQYSSKSLKVSNLVNLQTNLQWKQIVHQVLTLAISKTRTNTLL
jgi:hypothetical protein